MIRAFKPDDLPTITEIANRAWRGIYAMFKERYGEELFRLVVPDEATAKGSQVERHCEAHPDWILVCERDGRIVGFVTFRLDAARKIGVIGNNARHPDCHEKGVGQEMYAAVFERFREEGMLFAKVDTGLDCAHAPARGAYERAGFDISHEDVTYYMKL